jgi:hypothetical protein
MEIWNQPEIRVARQHLLDHPVYHALTTVEALRVFMEHHVYAVWDFMSLLKRLQRDLNPVVLPWVPPANREQTRFINEVVRDEESDNGIHGGHLSHFELYLEAMVECDAQTAEVRRFVDLVGAGADSQAALVEVGAPSSVRRFVEFTLDTAMHGKTHEVCAAFFFGRENLIPDMFDQLIQDFAARGELPYRFLYYLHRHVEVDGDHHGPLAERMLAEMCQGSDERVEEAIRMALRSLRLRGELWDGVLAAIEGRASGARQKLA